MKLTIDKSVADSNRRNKNVEEELNKSRELLKEKEKEILVAKDDNSEEFTSSRRRSRVAQGKGSAE